MQGIGVWRSFLFVVAVGVLGLSACAGEASAAEVLWTRTSISDMTSAAAAAGVVYVGGDYTTLFEIALEDGLLLSEHPVGTVGSSPPSIHSDGWVVCPTLDGKLYVVDTFTGETRSIDLESPIRTSAGIGWDGSIYVGTDDGLLYAVDPVAVEILWAYDVGEPVRSSPVIHPSGDVLFGCDDGVFRDVRPSGDLAWATALDGAVRFPAAIGPAGDVYVGTSRGWLYALGQTDGRVLWKVRAGTLGVHAPVVDEWGDIYATSLDGVLSCFSSWDGERVWSEPEGSRAEHMEAMEEQSDWFIGSPCLGGSDVLYALTRSGVVKAYATTGEPLWEIDLTAVAGWRPRSGEPSDGCHGLLDLGSAFGPPELALAGSGVLLVSAGEQLTALLVNECVPAFGGWPMFQGNSSRTGAVEQWAAAAVFPFSVDYAPEIALPDIAPIAPQGKSAGPTSSFTILSDSSDRSSPTLFQSTAIPPLDGEIALQRWTVDGEAQGEGEVLAFHFEDLGDHTVALTVTDDVGRTDVYERAILVTNLAPIAVLDVNPVDPEVGTVVTFSASASEDPDGGITSYEWSLIGGRPIAGAEGATLELTFLDPGVQKVHVTVADSDGATSEASREIHVAAPQVATAASEGVRYAFVIGVSAYQDDRITDLVYAEADASAFYEYAVDPNGGGFSATLSRSLVGEAASLKNITSQVSWLLREVDEGDLVLLFFAGHGGQDEDFNADEGDALDEYLIPVDGEKDNLYATAIRDDVLGDWLASLQHQGAKVLLVLDSCYSGGASRGSARTGMGGTLADVASESESQVVLCASEEFEQSFEDDDLGHGVFTHFLLKGLGAGEGAWPEADVDGDGRVLLAELDEYLGAAVPDYVEEEVGEGSSQHPIIYGGDEIIGSVWLSCPTAPVTGRVSVADAEATDVLVIFDVDHAAERSERFEVLRPVFVSDSNSIAMEVVAVVAVTYAIGEDHALCAVVEHVLPDVPIVQGLPVRAMVRSDEP
jgi:outer membrane protein assembly factor BamB/PKD repeat protein